MMNPKKVFSADEKLDSVKGYLLQLQQRLCRMLAAENGQAQFVEEAWTHAQGGGGLSRLLSNGQVLEKCGVNFSHIQGNQLPRASSKLRSELIDAPFQATGVSVVIHPQNPY